MCSTSRPGGRGPQPRPRGRSSRPPSAAEDCLASSCVAPGLGDSELHKQVTPLAAGRAGRRGRVRASPWRAASASRAGRVPGPWPWAPLERRPLGLLQGGLLSLPFRIMCSAEDLRKMSASRSCAAQRGVLGAVGSPGTGRGRMARAEAALGCQGGPWPWQRLPAAGVNTGFQRGPCFPVGALQFQTAGAFQAWGGKGERQGRGRGGSVCEETSPRVPLFSPAPGMFPGGPSFQTLASGE